MLEIKGTYSIPSTWPKHRFLYVKGILLFYGLSGNLSIDLSSMMCVIALVKNDFWKIGWSTTTSHWSEL